MTDKDDIAEIIERLQRENASLKVENKQLKNKVTSLTSDDNEFFALRELIALMPGNIFWKDKEGKLLGCNNNLARILSLTSPDEIIGKRTIDLIGTALAAQVDKIDKAIMNSTHATYTEEVGFNINKEPAIYLTYKIPLRNRKGEVVGLLGTSLDITEHKKMEKELKVAKEKAEASDRAKSQFLAVINHELRTPLTGIIGLINILKQNRLSLREKKRAIEDLEYCSQNLLNLVNDVLDFTRLESGKANIHWNTIHLRTHINEIFSIVSTIAQNKNVELHAYFDEKLPKYILIDARHLRQILINLINNAIKFTEKGYISVQVQLLKQTRQKATIEITVKDTGQGIPNDKLGLIFEPFQQLEDIYMRQSSRSGTGLGLAIVKRLATKLGIKIRVESEVGKGSAFILTGEFKWVEDKPFHSLPKFAQRKAPSALRRQSIKVLLIEDDRIVQYVHQQMLKELGCQVDVASCGQEALRLLNQQDIIFVDIGLSDITGFEVIRKIRAMEKYRLLPIIALTGYTGEEEKQACLVAGANEVQKKPISAEELESILTSTLSATF